VAWQGTAWRGKARLPAHRVKPLCRIDLGLAGRGGAGLGWARQGAARHGEARQGKEL